MIISSNIQLWADCILFHLHKICFFFRAAAPITTLAASFEVPCCNAHIAYAHGMYIHYYVNEHKIISKQSNLFVDHSPQGFTGRPMECLRSPVGSLWDIFKRSWWDCFKVRVQRFCVKYHSTILAQCALWVIRTKMSYFVRPYQLQFKCYVDCSVCWVIF